MILEQSVDKHLTCRAKPAILLKKTGVTVCVATTLGILTRNNSELSTLKYQGHNIKVSVNNNIDVVSYLS